jgi:lipoprotein NlpI
MKHLIMVALLALGASSRVLAAGYDDFSRGLTANNREESYKAIAEFTAALAAGDLNRNFIPNAYAGRAVANWRMKDCAKALDDIDAATKLRPPDSHILELRGFVHLCLNQPKLADTDYSELIAKLPDHTNHRARALVRLQDADADGALADVEEVLKDDSQEIYSILWLEMVRLRAGRLDPAKVRDDLPPLSLLKWPAPIFDLYSGKIDADAVQAAAAHGDDYDAKGQQCEADFYVAEWMMAKKDRPGAKALFQKALDVCPHSFVEYPAAQIEFYQFK